MPADPLLGAATEAAALAIEELGMTGCEHSTGDDGYVCWRCFAVAALSDARPLIEAQARREGAVEALRQSAIKLRNPMVKLHASDWLVSRADQIEAGHG